ncbi:MAG: hypothetical protein AAGD18_18880 [Actinomycetota bacterium]
MAERGAPKRGRGRPAGLSADQIVSAAIDAGLLDLNLRDVAARLGTGVSALYNHVDDRDDLIGRVVDQLVGQLELPQPRGQGIEEALLELGRAARQLTLANPGLASAMLRDPDRPSIRQKAQEGSTALTAEGADPDVSILLGSDVVFFVTSAALIAEASRSATVRPLPAMTIAESAFLDRMADLEPDAHFDWALRSHVRGLLASLGRGDLPWSPEHRKR